MKCVKCGMEIPEGMEYCEACKMELEEEQAVIDLTKVDLSKKTHDFEPPQDAIELEKYGKSLLSSMSNLTALLGAICMYIAPFSTWLSRKLTGQNAKGTLFDLAGTKSDIGLGEGTLSKAAIMLVIAGILMMIMSAREYMGFFQKIRKTKFMIVLRVIPVVLAVPAFLMVIMNKTFHTIVSFSYVHYGLGMWLCLGGIVIYIISILLTNKGEE